MKERQNMQNNVFNENVDYLYQVQTDLEAVEQLKSNSLIYTFGFCFITFGSDTTIFILIRINLIIINLFDLNLPFPDRLGNLILNGLFFCHNCFLKIFFLELTEENRQLQVEMKTLFKAQHVPSFCLTKMFYSLFMTKRFLEFLVLLLTILITYAGIRLIFESRHCILLFLTDLI